MSQELCHQVDEAMVELLEGEAPSELVEHIATCDRCRDARYDAIEAREWVEAAGADYEHPNDFEAKLLARLDGLDEEGASDAALDVDERSAGPESLARPAKTEEMPVASAKTQSPSSVEEAGEAVTEPIASRRKRSERGRLVWLRRPRNTVGTGLVAAALTAAGVALVMRPDAPVDEKVAAEPWTGTVANVSRAGGGEGGLKVCSGPSQCTAAVEGAEVAAGSELKTDARTRARVTLADGTTVVLDRSSSLSLVADASRRAKLTEGALVAEVTPRPEGGPAAVFAVAGGLVEVKGTKLALRAQGDDATVDVVRGAVDLVDAKGERLEVRAGQEGRLTDGGVAVTSAPLLAESLSWSETGEGPTAARGLGELRAKKPGTTEEKKGAVRLASHKVKVRIVDGFARTEVTEVFQNETNEVLEGIYRFPLPPGAQIERLALEVNGEMEEGAFVDRGRAAKIWRGAIVNGSQRKVRPREEIIWVPGPWEDPALLEWQRGGRFELRIFPIPRQGSRKVVLTYTEKVPATGDRRRYTYPLPHDASGDLTVADFDVDVQVRGHDDAEGVRSLGYAMSNGSGASVGSLSMQAQQFVPTGDLVVEYTSAARDREMTAWAYQPTAVGEAKAATGDDVEAAARAEVESDHPYLALALRPQLPAARDERQRAYAIVVDTSRSMMGERHRRATALATRLVQEMDRLDRFTVLACDTHCETLDAGWRTPGNQAAADVQQFLRDVTPDGASDPAGVLREAARRNPDGRRLEIVYIGDGTPTVGPVRPAVVSASLEGAIGADTRVTTVAIGADADADNLATLARAGGGVALPYVPGQRENEVAYAVLGATLGQSLRDVQVTLPPGVQQAAPAQVDTIVAGGEVLVSARMNSPQVAGEVVLRGRLGDEPFERRYPLDVRASRSDGNAFVPRVFAAARIRDLEREGTAEAKARAVALSGAFNVASRFTSLLVLESPAMFKAFGLDNQRRVATWTGDVLDDVSDEKVAAKGDDEGELSGGDKRLAKSKGQRGFDLDDTTAAGGLAAADEAPAGRSSGTGSLGPPMSRPSPAPAPATKKPMAASPRDPMVPMEEERSPRGRRMVPMRRIFVRQAQIFPGRTQVTGVDTAAIEKARREMEANPNRRAAVQELFTLYARAGRVEDAARLADLWADKEALDPEALTARAEVAAARGDRESAIRMLGSVIDVRPGDVNAQRRLARLHTWAGRPQDACLHRVALAELQSGDAKLLAEAVQCTRSTGQSPVGDALMRAAEDGVRKNAERELTKAPAKDLGVRGDVQVTATWQGGADVDLALVHPKGHRVSWLGAPTRAIISAADVTSLSTESLGLLGSPAGEYAIEVVRARPEGPGVTGVSLPPVTGELTIRAAGTVRKIPFTLVGDRVVVGTMRVSFRSQLVPVGGGGWGGWRR